jgi:hypothetical protein
MRRGSGPGPDGVTWGDYRDGLDSRIAVLSDQLRAGVWRPGPFRLVPISTFSGKPFEIVVPQVEDRVVHRAMAGGLQPILETRVLRDFVSGGRPARNRLTAVRQAAEHLGAGHLWVADLDVRSAAFGRTVEEVVTWTARWVSDGSYLRLLRQVLEPLPSAMQPGAALLSQMLHLMLVPVDDAVAQWRVVRFYDNYCVFTQTRPQADEAFARLCAGLAERGLVPSPAKSAVRHAPNPEDLFLSG